MKNKTLISKILTMTLSLLMLLGVSMTSVFALPGDYTAVSGGTITHDFEGSFPGSFITYSASEATPSISTEQAHSGSSSLKVVKGTGQNYAKLYLNGLTTGSTYYLSYWYYTNGWNANFAASSGAANYSQSSKAAGQWNKAWTKFTATAYNSIVLWDIGSATVYIDDLELVQVTSLDGFKNTVPYGASVVTEKTVDFEKAINVNSTFAAQNANVTTEVSIAESNCGEASLKLTLVPTATGAQGYYLNTNNSFASGIIEAGGTYYLSYYVYTAASNAKHFAYLIDATKIVQDTVLPQGEWTKISTIFTVSDTTGANANKHLFRVFVSDCGTTPVYFDDFVLAKLSSVSEAALTADTVAYDFDAKTATVTFDSSVEITGGIDTANITAPTGVTVNSASLSVDGKTVTVGLSGVDSNADIALTFANVKDAFGRTNNVETTFATPSAFEFTNVTEAVDGTNATYTRNITKNSNGSANIAMIVAAYNAQGEMISVGMDINSVSGGGAPATPFSVTITKGAVYKVYTLDWSSFISIE